MVFSVTAVTDGWTCKVMVFASSICGVTSSAMPEKNGVSVSVGNVVVPLLLLVPAVIVPPATFVTKYSSTPTLRTAFWLFKVAIRGLDRICTSPWLSRKPSTAAKPFVASARPSVPAPPEGSETPSVTSAPIACGKVGRPLPLLSSGLFAKPLVCPTLPRLRRIDQSMPLWKPSLSSTSTIFASSITWRSTARRDARRYASTWRSSSGIARTAIVPDCGLTITLRPLPVPTMLRSASAVSAHRSDTELVDTCVLSGASAELAGAGVPPVAPDGWLGGAEPALTRTSLRPWRFVCR